MQETQQPKVCKQCKYWSYEQSTNVCKHEMSKVSDVEINVINGCISKAVYKDCAMMRFYSNCGEQAVLFEPKTSILQSVVKFIKELA